MENDPMRSKKINKVGSNHLSIDELIDIRYPYPKNHIIGYLNINSLRNKIISLREIIDVAPLNIFCIGTKKLDECIPDLQL